GGATGGPPFSRQRRHSHRPSDLCSSVHSTETVPALFEKAPYLTALVASSLNAMPSASAALGDSRIFLPSIVKRSARPPATPNGSSTCTTRSRNPAPCHFSRPSRSCERDSAAIRVSIDSRTTCGSDELRTAWATIDWTVASVFLTR